jgi:hypothetical protein
LRESARFEYSKKLPSALLRALLPLMTCRRVKFLRRGLLRHTLLSANTAPQSPKSNFSFFASYNLPYLDEINYTSLPAVGRNAIENIRLWLQISEKLQPQLNSAVLSLVHYYQVFFEEGFSWL